MNPEKGGSPLTKLSCISKKRIKLDLWMISWIDLREDQIISLQFHIDIVSVESFEGAPIRHHLAIEEDGGQGFDHLEGGQSLTQP